MPANTQLAHLEITLAPASLILDRPSAPGFDHPRPGCERCDDIQDSEIARRWFTDTSSLAALCRHPREIRDERSGVRRQAGQLDEYHKCADSAGRIGGPGALNGQWMQHERQLSAPAPGSQLNCLITCSSAQ